MLEVKYDSENGVVETFLSGVVSAAELNTETVKAAALAREHNCDLFLSDYSDAEMDFSIVDVFELPDLQRGLGMSRENTRAAVVVPTTSSEIELARDYEIACMSRGWVAKVFKDRKIALAWLLDSSL